MKTSSEHQDLIIDQFTRQATPFAEKPEHSDAVVMERNLRFSKVKPTDAVLDTACGPGLVSCAFAAVAEKVTGIDITPAMLMKAKELQASRGLANMTWDLGDSTALPYADDSFSLVVSRYSFHHLLEPLKAWQEMVRVCRPGGTVLVIDVALPAEKAPAYDRFEILRDPSHARALTLTEFPQMAQAVGLKNIEQDFYRLAMEPEQLIAASFPKEENRQVLRDMLRRDLGKNELGFEVELREQQIWLSFPTLAIRGIK